MATCLASYIGQPAEDTWCHAFCLTVTRENCMQRRNSIVSKLRSTYLGTWLHVSNQRQTPRPFFFSEYCPFPEQSFGVIKRFSSDVTAKNRDVPRETEVCVYVRTYERGIYIAISHRDVILLPYLWTIQTFSLGIRHFKTAVLRQKIRINAFCISSKMWLENRCLSELSIN